MLSLTDTALTVLEKRYLRHDPEGNLIEDPEGMFRRVAHAVAQAEPPEKKEWAEEKFSELMFSLRFLPNSPTLMNAGITGTLSACFVLDIEDSLQGILETAARAGKILKYGGGCGFNLSNIRSRTERVRSTNGKACGPVAVLRHLHSLNTMVQQAGKRNGANMAVLRCDHKDIEGFITCKREDPDSIYSFNLSVALTDEFMEKAKQPNVYDKWPVN